MSEAPMAVVDEQNVESGVSNVGSRLTGVGASLLHRTATRLEHRAADNPADAEHRGFLHSLFDTHFHDYVTPIVVRIFYKINIALFVLLWLAGIIMAFVASPGIGFAVLLLGWIPGLWYLISIRMTLEAVLALVRLAKDTRRIWQHEEYRELDS